MVIQKHPVFILSLFDTGYYAARLLKKTGIPIYGFDHVRDNPGFYSKYITATLVPHPQDDADKLLEILLEKRSEFSLKPVLIAASENYLEFILSKWAELQENFLFLLPDKETLGRIISKSSQLDMARQCELSVPAFRTVSHTEELEHACDVVEYPVVVKGIDQPLWKRKIRKKAFIAKNKSELLQIGENLLKQNVSFVVQKIVGGDCRNNYEFNALVVNGKIIERNLNQKLRQYPLDFGSACCLRTAKNDQVEQLATKFLLQNEIEGFSNTEFKFDEETGKYFFIETNARVWQQIELTKKRGQNFVSAYYDHLTNSDNPSRTGSCTPTARWVDLPTDLLVFLRYRRQINLSLLQFIKSLLTASNLGLFSISDIKPFLKAVHLIK